MNINISRSARGHSPHRYLGISSALYKLVALGLGASLAVAMPAAYASGPASAHTLAECSATNLTGTQVWSGFALSNHASYVLLTNTGSQACLMTGYPQLSGATDSDSNPVDITVTDGPIYMRPDPGPVSTVVDPGYSVSFNLGTGTGYGTTEIEIAAIDLQLGGGSTLPVAVTLPAEPATAGGPVPVGATAFEPDAGRCDTTDLALSIPTFGVIDDYSTALAKVTNVGTSPCSVYGYPGVTLYGADSTAVPVSILYGDTYNMVDPGPSTVVLSPGGAADFGMSTYVGYGTANVTFDKLQTTLYSVSGSEQKASLEITDLSSRLYGQFAPGATAITVNVTALGAAS